MHRETMKVNSRLMRVTTHCRQDYRRQRDANTGCQCKTPYLLDWYLIGISNWYCIYATCIRNMPYKEIIARLEQHLDHHGRLTLRPAESPSVFNQAHYTRQLLQQMVVRREVNNERRAQEFNQLRALMATRQNCPEARDQAHCRQSIGDVRRPSAHTAKSSARGAKPGSHAAWWSQPATIALPTHTKAMRHWDPTFAATMAATTPAFSQKCALYSLSATC